MNSNDKVLEVLLKISQSLDEIKTQMKTSSSNTAVDTKKIEETVKEVESGILNEGFLMVSKIFSSACC